MRSPASGVQVAVDEQDRWDRLLAESASGRDFHPEEICRLCIEMLGVSGAGISMVTPAGTRSVVFSSDDTSARIEDLQFTVGEGPCVDAVTFGRPVLVGDLANPDDVLVERWPQFMEGARLADVRAVFSFPLRIGAISIGALDLYSNEPLDVSENWLSSALMAADAVALALLLDTHLEGRSVDDFDVQSTFQVQVHQATGMVQVQLDMSAEDALLTLRARAFSSGRPLTEISSDVVSRRLRFAKEDE
jgi:hypothetical protein